MGSRCARSAAASARDYTNLVRVEAVSDGEALRVAGTTIGNDDRLWLVSALGFELDIELSPLLVVFRYDDVPGVIGKVGSTFGEAGVNIGEHDGVAHASGRPGPDGALDRHAATGITRAANSFRLRRRPVHLAGVSLL